MRRDPIFYQMFQHSPTWVFDLIGERPSNAEDYRFDSVAVKDLKFEMDGVFLPPESNQLGAIYFCEVQLQKDEQLYKRLSMSDFASFVSIFVASYFGKGIE